MPENLLLLKNKAREKRTKQIEDIIKKLKDGEGIAMKEIADKIGITENTIRKTVAMEKFSKVTLGRTTYYCSAKTAANFK